MQACSAANDTNLPISHINNRRKRTASGTRTMNCLTSRYTNTFFRLGALAAAWLVCSGAAALAQNVGSFTLKISEKEMNLEHPTDGDWKHYLMWDLGFQRMTDRNMPYLELTNDAESNAPITEFRLKIGDTRFHFDDSLLGSHAMLAHTTPGFQISSHTVNNLGDELVITIGNGGLQPEQKVRFKVDLAVDDQFADMFFMHPDFRTVFFDMNGLNVYDGFLQDTSKTDNATASAVFDPASGPNFTVGPIAFGDEPVQGAAADFFNDNYRDYGEMDPVRTFRLGGDGTEVPEPASFMLALVGTAAWFIATARSRRRVLRAA
jgi:hypothetical protein